jgi:hypothetical protein
MSSKVIIQIALASKSLPAVLASKRLILPMYSHMNLEISLYREAFLADDTLVVTLIFMRTLDVLLKVIASC